MLDLIPLILFACSTSFTPGPNNIMLMNSGLHYGIKRSLPHYLGICLGFPVMVLLVALGFGVVFVHYVWLKHVLKILGSLYMLYLAWQILLAHTRTDAGAHSKPFTFIQITLFQWVNPKAWLMAVGAISIFNLSNSYFLNALWVSGIFLLACLPCVGAWLIFGSLLKKILKEERHQRWFNVLMALGLLVSILMIWVE